MKKMMIGLLIAGFIVGIASSAFAACKVGDKADVLWKGKWYPATVKKVKGSECFIHYTGYSKSWDEWVGPGRIRIKGQHVDVRNPTFEVGDAVEVNWKGSWYPAHVISVRRNRWKVHYDGYSDSWDEWVTARRIRAK